MKVHLVFSLNVTGSFTDGIRGSLLAKKVPEITEHRINMNGEIFFSLYRRKKNFFRVII